MVEVQHVQTDYQNLSLTDFPSSGCLHLYRPDSSLSRSLNFPVLLKLFAATTIESVHLPLFSPSVLDRLAQRGILLVPQQILDFKVTLFVLVIEIFLGDTIVIFTAFISFIGVAHQRLDFKVT